MRESSNIVALDLDEIGAVAGGDPTAPIWIWPPDEEWPWWGLNAPGPDGL